MRRRWRRSGVFKRRRENFYSVRGIFFFPFWTWGKRRREGGGLCSGWWGMKLSNTHWTASTLLPQETMPVQTSLWAVLGASLSSCRSSSLSLIRKTHKHRDTHSGCFFVCFSFLPFFKANCIPCILGSTYWLLSGRRQRWGGIKGHRGSKGHVSPQFSFRLMGPSLFWPLCPAS